MKRYFKIFKEFLRKFLILYTPFICSVVTTIHGVLFILNHKGCIYSIFANASGYSMLLLAYVLATAHKRCKWYKRTCWILMTIPVLNLLKRFKVIGIEYAYIMVILGLLAFMSFLIFMVTSGIVKAANIHKR